MVRAAFIMIPIFLSEELCYALGTLINSWKINARDSIQAGSFVLQTVPLSTTVYYMPAQTLLSFLHHF